LPAVPALAEARADFEQMLGRQGLVTSDPLGLGGLLVDACRLAQLDVCHGLTGALLAAAAKGLRRFAVEADLEDPAEVRLGFRELGLAIGLEGISMLDTDAVGRRLDASGQASLAELWRYAPLREEIEWFWLRPQIHRAASWVAHEDINEVMLATSLAPDGFLALGSPVLRSWCDVSTPPA
jgi:hypothetical protein